MDTKETTGLWSGSLSMFERLPIVDHRRGRWHATLTRGIRIVLLSTVFLWASESFPCSSPIDPAAADRRDRERQREMAGELANQADAIFVATATVVYPSPTSVTFRVERVLKGWLEEGVVSYPLPALEEIGCGPAANFRSVSVWNGLTYLVYARDGKLLRVANTKRKWPEISSREEIRLIRKRLASDDA